MTREDRFSSPTDGVTNDYNKFTEDEAYKRYAENIKMFPVDDTPKDFDKYKELDKLSKRLYKNVKPNKKDIQERLTPYTPKNFGEKRTYPQDWPMYQKACSQEKLMFLKLIKDAVDYMMVEYEYKGNGRPPAYYGDIVKVLCIKSYNNYSSWRAESELKIARSMGIIDNVPKRSTILKYMQDPKAAKMLDKLYKILAEPLAEIEVYFSADATGISNKYGNTRWIKIRHTAEEAKHRREYSKLHIISGVKTNCICSAKITSGTAHESPFFKPLLDDTAKIFNVKEMSADAGYLSKDNVKAISGIGAAPFIMGKKNVNVPMKGSSSWGLMLRLWKKHQMFFCERYFRRANIESTFSMVKRKFGDFCRSKKPESQQAEILSRICCHNAVVLAEALLSYDLKKGFMASL